MTVDTRHYPNQLDLDYVSDIIKEFARKVEELEEEREQLKQQVEDQKRNYFKGVNG